MSQSVDIQLSSIEDILQILRNQAIAIQTPSTSSRYLRALDSLESSVLSLQSSDCGQASNISQSSEDSKLHIDLKTEDLRLKTSLTNWLVNQWLMNIPFSTASLYLDIISSLYGSAAKAGLLPPTKIFSQVKASLKELGADGWKGGIDDEIFARALRLTKNASHLIADDATAAAMVIWSLTHSLQSLTEIALLKKSDLSANPAPQGGLSQGDSQDNSSFIINHSSLKSQRRQYLFPLRQSQRTPKQLQAHVARIVNDLFRRARLPQASDPFQTVETLWAYAALRTGISASIVVSYLGHAPLGLPVLKLSVGKIPDSGFLIPDTGLRPLSSGYLAAVGRVFLENPPRWYAMSLRPGVRFTQVCSRIQLLYSSNAQRTTHNAVRDTHNAERVTLFYPCEEIVRAIGKKIVSRQRPFIHSVVFFRAKLTDIGRLFSKIGDLAWCYRQSARPGAPYAEISDRQFQLFQQTIARFTPDYEVASTGELELKEGDRIEILGGLFAGREATYEESRVSLSENGKRETEKDNASGVVYRLNIIGDNGIEWRISVDSRLAIPK